MVFLPTHAERKPKVSRMLGNHCYQWSIPLVLKNSKFDTNHFKKVKCMFLGFSREFRKTGWDKEIKMYIYSLKFLRNIVLKVWPGLEAPNLKGFYHGGGHKIQHLLFNTAGLKNGCQGKLKDEGFVLHAQKYSPHQRLLVWSNFG